MRTYYDRIPDLTERYPEGFGGVDMCAPRDPEYDFWRAVEEADRLEREYLNKPRRDMWVSFYLQDGTQGMATISARDYDDACEQMREEYGDEFGEIVDYEFYDDMAD